MRRTRLGRLPGVPALVMAASVVGLAFFGLPVAVLVVRALVAEGGLLSAVSDPAVRQALALSLLTTSISLAITVIGGTALAYALAMRALPGGRYLETIVDLPIVLPPSVAGLALLLLLGRRGVLGTPLGSLGLEVAFTTTAVIVAQVFVSAPFYVRSARTGFRSIGRDLVETAQVDGAGDWTLLGRVMLPLAATAIGTGIVLAWVRALGEFGATILFAGSLEGRTQTLPLLVYGAFQTSLGEAIAAAAILVLAAVAVLLVARFVRGRSGGTIDPIEVG